MKLDYISATVIITCTIRLLDPLTDQLSLTSRSPISSCLYLSLSRSPSIVHRSPISTIPAHQSSAAHPNKWNPSAALKVNLGTKPICQLRHLQTPITNFHKYTHCAHYRLPLLVLILARHSFPSSFQFLHPLIHSHRFRTCRKLPKHRSSSAKNYWLLRQYLYKTFFPPAIHHD